MPSPERLVKRESRTRGAARRQVNVDSFEVKPLQNYERSRVSIEGYKPKSLKSALVNDHDLDTLPRLRRPSSILPRHDSRGPEIKSEEPGVIETPRKQLTSRSASRYGGTHDRSDADDDFDHEDDLFVDEPEPEASPIITPRRSKRILDRLTTRSNKLNKLFTQAKASRPLRSRESEKKAETTVQKRAPAARKAVPKVVKPKVAQKAAESPVTVPRLLEKSVSKSVPRSKAKSVDKRTKPAATVPKRAVSLTKSRQAERQKPLYVDLERVRVSSKRRKLFSSSSDSKPTTIDVLQYLVKTFEPPATPSASLNEDVVNETFKSHVLYHLGTLIDTHASIGNLTQEIIKVQKKKDEMRNRIYELRHNHSTVGNEMNELRAEYQKTKLQFENMNQLDRKLSDLRNQEDTEQGQTSLSDAVTMDLLSVDQIVNPVHGIFQKFVTINEKLAELDQQTV
ncbi:hypothetical protein CLIB1423_15S01596 [[Candida] railenensis]|uniref:Inner kinetochore subunit AME1 domain-containing protein n=1 Tax=[Candida] railenensis TaxID=45579 RepID=A0A9P0QTV9_9ASCO|nr:hypothetical protein CLIB1423_15S01596 [[Candida] railenensis]